MNEMLSELFSSKIRAAVLEQMLPRPHVGYSLTDLSRRLDLPISSLQHECYKLERIGVVKGRRDGNSRRYRVDPACPVLAELTALIVAAIGQDAALRGSMENIPGLDAAFLAAAVPLSADAQASGPIPLVLIGEISLEEIDAAQERVTKLLGLSSGKIEAVFYRSNDWRTRLAQQSQYAMWLVSGPRTDLLGDALNP
jgi:DNA-binding transcriptional ArsR family regulator